MIREPQLPPQRERRTQFSASRIALQARAGLRGAPFAAFLAVVGSSPSGTACDAQLSDTEWREFQRTWTAAGSRHVLRLGVDQQSSIAHVDGTLLLAE